MTKDNTPGYRLTIRRAVRLTPADDDQLQAISHARGGSPISNILREAIVEFIRNHQDPQMTNNTGPSMNKTTKGDR